MKVVIDMKKVNVIYHCDRCRKEIKENTGTLSAIGDVRKPKAVSVLRLSLKNHNEGGTSHSSYDVDLCNDCFESLNNWFSSDKYKIAESKWLIEDDLPKMNQIIIFMARAIKEYELTSSSNKNVEVGVKSIILKYMDKAEDYLQKEKDWTEHTE
jgi:hypothetical protein